MKSFRTQGQSQSDASDVPIDQESIKNTVRYEVFQTKVQYILKVFFLIFENQSIHVQFTGLFHLYEKSNG